MRTAHVGGRTARIGLAASLVVGLFLVAGVGAARGGSSVAPGEQQADPWVIAPRRAALPNPVPHTDEVVAKGRELYLLECSTCHGQEGQNDGPGARNVDDMHLSRFLTDPTLQEESDGSFYWKITEGRGSMPSTEKELSDEQRWMIVHYLRTLPDQD